MTPGRGLDGSFERIHPTENRKKTQSRRVVRVSRGVAGCRDLLRAAKLFVCPTVAAAARTTAPGNFASRLRGSRRCRAYPIDDRRMSFKLCRRSSAISLTYNGR
jgi:hypothetical protein